MPPFILEQWVQEPSGLEQAQQLDFVLYGGGPLSAATGNPLSQATDVSQMYGSAETGQIQLLVPQKGKWAYMKWNPYEEVDMQPSTEDAYEMVLHQDPKFSKRRTLHHNFPDVMQWRTGDLFVLHPTKVGLWRFLTRVDDLILLSSGHKVNPVVNPFYWSIHYFPERSLLVLVDLSPPFYQKSSRILHQASEKMLWSTFGPRFNERIW